ncbi:MAG TPA: hypothetical protein VFT91_11075, partial [Dehalococcoidia bacterium]|nr:hypothetical protein [Dehalococcoidia bacterium]
MTDMRTRPLTLFMALAAGSLLLAVACKGGSGEKAVNDTAGDISDEQLQQMVLALGEFGPEFAEFRLDPDSGSKTAEQVAQDDFDPAGEAQDLERSGWAADYQQSFLNQQADPGTFDLFLASSDVALFQTEDGAAGYFADTQSELAELDGKTSADGFTVKTAETFGSDVADQSLAFRISGTVDGGDGTSYAASVTGVGFRHGRIVASVAMAAYGKVQADEKLRDLAGALDERIASVLAGTAASREPGGAGTPEPLVSNAAKALGASAERFQREVSSLRGEAEFNMDIGGIAMQGTATFAFQAPDRIYMTMEFTGGGQQDSGAALDLSGLGTVEMLMLGTDIYMKIPLAGDKWGVMSLTDMGVDADQFREMTTSNHS